MNTSRGPSALTQEPAAATATAAASPRNLVNHRSGRPTSRSARLYFPSLSVSLSLSLSVSLSLSLSLTLSLSSHYASAGRVWSPAPPRHVYWVMYSKCPYGYRPGVGKIMSALLGSRSAAGVVVGPRRLGSWMSGGVVRGRPETAADRVEPAAARRGRPVQRAFYFL